MNHPGRVALTLLVLVAGCQAGSGSASPSAPAESFAPSPSPSPSASQASLPFPTIELPPGSAARLEQPLTAFMFPGEPPTFEVAAGTEVVVVGGPREHEGETWYETRYPLATDQQLLAWVQIADPAAVSPIAAECPADLAQATDLLPWDRLTCLGGATFEVVGQVGHCQGGVVQVEPEWLAYACWVVSVDGGGSFGLHAPPESGISFPNETVRARMTGHFDDPAASRCLYIGGLEEASQGPGPAEQVLLCREAFVVETFEILEVLDPGTAG